MLRLLPLAALFTGLGACDCEERPNDSDPDVEETSEEEPGFRHSRSGLLANDEDAHHVAVDAIGRSGTPIRFRAKFAYGTTSQDLEDENVQLVILGPNGTPTELGSALTDGDGWARIFVGSEQLPEPGRYRLRFTVTGDRTTADAWLFVLPQDGRVVVFDIDGTLTTGDSEVFGASLLGEEEEVREAAVDVAVFHAEQGRQPVYVTGRPYPLAAATHAWLEARGFPPGPLFTTRSVSDAAPTDEGVKEFKKAVLRELRDDGHADITHAYGNALTDVCAYAEVGIPPDHTFIVGEHGGAACGDRDPTVAVSSYAEHLQSLRAADVGTPSAVDAAADRP